MDFIIFNRICCEAGPRVSNFVVLENESYDFILEIFILFVPDGNSLSSN